MAHRTMIAPIPFLVHSLFAIGGWLLRGGVVSGDCFLISGKATIIDCSFHRTTAMNDEWRLITSRGPEQCMQYGLDGRTDGWSPYWSHFHEVGSRWVTHRTQNPTQHPKRVQHQKLQSNTHKSLLLSHSKLHTAQPKPVYKAVIVTGKL